MIKNFFISKMVQVMCCLKNEGPPSKSQRFDAL